ncbi:MAG: hypothetical protein ACFFF4_01000 [Candidatus Thorarchaeota archaeon]
MTYEDDITKIPTSTTNPQTEDACFVFTIIITLLMIILGVPSLASAYENPLPMILTLGFTALVMSILYLGLILKKTTNRN